VWHYEPPEVAWLPPELEVGEEPELRPLELELLELEEDEPELVELEPDELEPVEPELVPDELDPDEPEPELAEDEPDEPELDPVEADVLVLCEDPGRARASAPAVTTLATVTAVVVDRTLSRPRSLAAMARRIPSRCALLMYPILRSRTRKSLHEPSRKPLSRAAYLPVLAARLPRQHEGQLKPGTWTASAGLVGEAPTCGRGRCSFAAEGYPAHQSG
jgi:hypothetical protein